MRAQDGGAAGPVRAVVLDVGSVLEVVDDSLWPGPFERRHGLAPGAVHAVRLGGDPLVGELTEAEVRAGWRDALGLDDVAADELMTDFWRWCTGTLDHELLAWFAAQRPARRTGILSNSAPGAREAERHHGFEAVTDDIVCSHEVGLAKPDPRILALSARRLGVRPAEVLLLEDVEENVAAARACGWRAVLHTATATSIAAMEAGLAGRCPEVGGG